MPASRDNARGILAMNAAMASFIINDSMVKAAAADLPLGEMMFVRGVAATLLLVALTWWTGGFAARRHLVDRMILFRVVGELGATLFYLSALVLMPIGNLTAIFQVTPLAVTAGAAIFLGERVGWRRWLAIATGFLGVMVIVRPGIEGFDRGAVLILASVGFVVLRDLATARMPDRIPTFLAALSTSVVITLAGLALLPFEGAFSPHEAWRPVGAADLAILVAAGAFLVSGYVFLTIAMRSGEMAVVAPFRYSLLIWSFVIGIVFFGERPDLWTIVGGLIVVATGLYSFHRERLRRRAASEAAA